MSNDFEVHPVGTADRLAAAPKQAEPPCKYADMCNDEGECVNGCEEQKPQSAKPVAWMDDFGNTFPLSANKGADWKPLYTAPPDQSARIAELERENRRLVGEVANRNARALEGDKAMAAFNAEFERAEKAERELESAHQAQRDAENELARQIAQAAMNETQMRAEVEALRAIERHGGARS